MLEFHICRSRHPRTGAPDHLAGAGGAVPQEVDHHRRHRPRRHHVGEMRVGDRVVGAVAATARAAHVRVEHRNHLAQVAHVGRARAMARLAAFAGAEEGVNVSPEGARHRRVGTQRQIARQGVDLDLGAEGQGTGPERPVDLLVGVAYALERATADVRLDPRFTGDHVHLRAAVRQDRVDADRVVVAEGLAQRIDPRERDLGRVERVDAHMGRAAGVRRAPDEARRLAEAAVVGARNTRRTVLGPRRGVDHHRQVDVVQVAQTQQLALAAEEFESPFANLVEPPLEVAAFLGRDGHQGETASQMLERPGRHETDRGADQARDLSVVAAGVNRARRGIGLGMAGDNERVELAQERERRPWSLAAGHVGAHAREGEPGPRRQTELAKLRLDEGRGSRLLEAELRVAADRFSDLDDLIGVALDRLVDGSLELVPSHGTFSSPTFPPPPARRPGVGYDGLAPRSGAISSI